MMVRKVLMMMAATAVMVAGCSYEDADTQSPAIASLDVQLDTSSIARHKVYVSGTIHLSYVSDKMVVLRVLDNDSEVLSSTYAATSLDVPFSMEVPVLHEDTNVITLEAAYNGEKVRRVVSVDEPGAIQGFELVPDATVVDQYRVHVTGKASFGWYSQSPAVLSVSVNGSEVYAESLWVTASDGTPTADGTDSAQNPLEKFLSFDLPLSSVGYNDVVAVLKYGGHEAKVQFQVFVPGSIELLEASAATEVQELSVEVSGRALFGHLSMERAALEILVNGTKVYEENMDVSQLDEHPFSVRVPLREGSNEIVVRLSYDGDEAVRYLSVLVPSGIQDFEASVPAQVHELEATVSGTMVFGYVSDTPARLDILVDGEVAYSEDVSVDSTTLLEQPFSVNVPLPSDGGHSVEARLSYGSSERVVSMVVQVPLAIQNLDLSLMTSPVTTYSAEIFIEAAFGYMSDESALLKVLVNGSEVYSDILTPDLNSVMMTLDIPLSADSNDVVAEVSYGGRVMRKHLFVQLSGSILDAIDAEITVDNDVDYEHDRGIVGHIDGDNTDIRFVKSTDYDTFEVRRISYSWDDGETWHDMTDQFVRQENGNEIIYIMTASEVDMPHMDIGHRTVYMKMEGLVNGREFTKVVASGETVHADPYFSCSRSAMSPTTTLFERLETNYRTLEGWFGLPGKHSLVISIYSTSDRQAIGGIVSQTDSAVTVAFPVRNWTSGYTSSSLDYTLEVYLDGDRLCRYENYGEVTDN